MTKTIPIGTALVLGLTACGTPAPSEAGQEATAPPQLTVTGKAPAATPTVGTAPRVQGPEGQRTGASATPEAQAEAGCGKVDFLFVVDNSLSMLAEQEALASSFPGFMTVVESTLNAGDFHVMVVDTDAGSPGAELSSLLNSLLGGAAPPAAAGGQDACADTLGAGRRWGQEGQDCGLPSGRSFLDASDDDLASAFSCLAQVGITGNPREAPAAALLASLSPELNAAGNCNEGFLREDAVLVVTLIGDEDDTVSPGDPEEWYQSVVDLKGGNEQSVVFLGLVGGDSAESTCADGPVGAARLGQLAEKFTYGSASSVCAIDFAPFFESSVSVIDTACDSYVPPILR